MKAKNLNKIHFPDIKKEKGIIRYRSTGIRKEDTPGNKRKLIIIDSNVPAHDMIVDENGDQKQIALIRRVKNNGEVVLGHIGFGVFNGGEIIINPKKAKSAEISLYKYMEMTDYNGSKKDRDPRKPIKFFRIDEEAKASSNLEAKKLINKAENLVLELTEKEVEDLADIIALPEMANKPAKVKQELLLGYAKDNAQLLIDTITNKSKDVIHILKVAATEKLIIMSKKDGNFTMNNEVIGTFENKIGVKPYDILAEQLKENNPDLIDTLAKRIDHLKKEREQKELEANKSGSDL